MFHVKDAEFRPTLKGSLFTGLSIPRTGQTVSFAEMAKGFQRHIFQADAVYLMDGPCWRECCIEGSEQELRKGPFIQRHIIQAASSTFDDFASSGADQRRNRRMLGLD
jgi:hypothetical protein